MRVRVRRPDFRLPVETPSIVFTVLTYSRAGTTSEENPFSGEYANPYNATYTCAGNEDASLVLLVKSADVSNSTLSFPAEKL